MYVPESTGTCTFYSRCTDQVFVIRYNRISYICRQQLSSCTGTFTVPYHAVSQNKQTVIHIASVHHHTTTHNQDTTHNSIIIHITDQNIHPICILNLLFPQDAQLGYTIVRFVNSIVQRTNYLLSVENLNLKKDKRKPKKCPEINFPPRNCRNHNDRY